MKKTIITIAIILGIGMTAFAGGGLFQRNINAENGNSGYVFYDSKGNFFTKEDSPEPLLPAHGEFDDQPAPVGSGIVALMGMGVAYLLTKRREQE